MKKYLTRVVTPTLAFVSMLVTQPFDYGTRWSLAAQKEEQARPNIIVILRES